MLRVAVVLRKAIEEEGIRETLSVYLSMILGCFECKQWEMAAQLIREARVYEKSIEEGYTLDYLLRIARKEDEDCLHTLLECVKSNNGTLNFNL